MPDWLIILIVVCGFGILFVLHTRTSQVKQLTIEANLGNAEAQFNLGMLYASGRGVEQNYEKAKEYWIKSANQGFIEAQAFMGNLYFKTEHNYQKAKEYWEKAAKQKNPDAQCGLGILYSEGLGVEQDHTKAVEWWKKASEQGYALAQVSLAGAYFRGDGVLQNKKYAYIWQKIATTKDWSKFAATNGLKRTENILEIIMDELTGEEFLEANEIMAKMVRENPKIIN